MSAFEQWLTDEQKGAYTVRNYVREVALFSSWWRARTGEALTVAMLNGADVRAYLAEHEAAGAKPATRNIKLAALRAWERWGREFGNLPTDAAPLQKVKRARAVRLQPKHLSHADGARLEREISTLESRGGSDYAKAKDMRDVAILRLLGLGLRVSEVCGLELSCVVCQGAGGQVRVMNGKGNKERMVPLSQVATDAMVEWLKVRPDGGGQWVFIGKRGEQLKPRGVETLVSEIARRANVEMTPHTLRHTIGHRLVSQGTPLTFVQDLLGHTNLQTTAIYTRPSLEDLREAVGRVQA